MILIPSAAYVQGDLRAEFGNIPPVFLPIGNRPLLASQISTLRSVFVDEEIVLSLPAGCEVGPALKAIIDEERITVIETPSDCSLAKSLLHVLGSLDGLPNSLRILHGDTLFTDLPRGLDVISVSTSTSDFGWEEAPTSNESKSYWCGFFSFSDVAYFVTCLALSDGNFAEAVKSYFARHSVDFVESKSWHDCGHLNTYLQSKRLVTTQRVFNELSFTDGGVVKSGSPREKILSEANWFKLLPVRLKPFAPALYEVQENVGQYEIEYLPMPALNEIFVHGRQPVSFWQKVFEQLNQWLILSTDYGKIAGVEAEGLSEERQFLIETKTASRVDDYVKAVGLDIDRPLSINGEAIPSLRQIITTLTRESLNVRIFPGVLHGDLCFSNSMWDSRNERLRLLDPRGVAKNFRSMPIRDIVYDIAKFSHSVVGFYDLIIANEFKSRSDFENGQFDLEIQFSNEHSLIRQEFMKTKILGDNSIITNSFAQMILLFLTMPPLHSDDPVRQSALFANGLKLFAEFYK